MLFSLLRISLGTANALPHVPTQDEWEELYILAKKQAVLGICYKGIQRLPHDQQPQEELLQKWITKAFSTVRVNRKLNEQCDVILSKITGLGFNACILKGQGLAKIYPQELQELRTPGDIDILFDGDRQDAQNVSKVISGNLPWHNDYKHANIKIEEEVDVELHYRSELFYNPFRTLMWLHWCKTHKDLIYTGFAPSPRFNAIYILLHIFSHITLQGIGLKQLLDYYFVLDQGFSADDRKSIARQIRLYGITRTASAVMWILVNIFGLDESKTIIAPNEKAGRYLLDEIMQTGNFGKSDTRFSYYSAKTRNNSMLHKFWKYPMEIGPFFMYKLLVKRKL